jgi:hypothetical protein
MTTAEKTVVRLYPQWEPRHRQSFVNAKDAPFASHELESGTVVYESLAFRTGRFIDVHSRLPPNCLYKPHEELTAELDDSGEPTALIRPYYLPFLRSVILRTESGQLFHVDLSYQDPEDRFRFEAKKESLDLLQAGDAVIHFDITPKTRALDGKPLEFNLDGEESVHIVVKCPIYGEWPANDYILIESATAFSEAVYRNSDDPDKRIWLTQGNRKYWGNLAFEFVGFNLAIEVPASTN